MLNGTASSSTGRPHPAVEELTMEVALSPCPVSSTEGWHWGISPVFHSRDHPCVPWHGSPLGSSAGINPVIPWLLWDRGVQDVGQRAGAGTLNTGPAYIWPTAWSKPHQHDGHGASTQEKRGHPAIGTLWHSSLWSHRAGLPKNDLTWSDLICVWLCSLASTTSATFFLQDRETAVELRVLPTQNAEAGGEAKAVPSSSFGEDRPAHKWRVNAFFPLWKGYQRPKRSQCPASAACNLSPAGPGATKLSLCEVLWKWEPFLVQQTWGKYTIFAGCDQEGRRKKKKKEEEREERRKK